MNDTSYGAESIFLIFATINDQMIEIARELRANANVKAATSGCDIRRFQDFMQPEQRMLHFMAYVEAEIPSGDVFTWSLGLKKTPARWEIDRVIYRQGDYGGIAIVSFEDAVFEEVADVAKGFSPLLEEFVASAKSFDFVSPPTDCE